jgi:hypothetical protein
MVCGSEKIAVKALTLETDAEALDKSLCASLPFPPDPEKICCATVPSYHRQGLREVSSLIGK